MRAAALTKACLEKHALRLCRILPNAGQKGSHVSANQCEESRSMSSGEVFRQGRVLLHDKSRAKPFTVIKSYLTESRSKREPWE